jgi:hypothetical protein
VFHDTYHALATRTVLACTASLKPPSGALDASLSTPLMQRIVAAFLVSGNVPAFVHASRAARLRALWSKTCPEKRA